MTRARQIQYGKSRMRETRHPARINPDPAIIRSPLAQGFRHAPQRIGIGRPENSCDSTH